VLHLAIVLLACALVAQVTGNNLSTCSGAIVSSRMVSRRAGVWITSAGYACGLVLEGGVMRTGFAKLMPDRTDALVLIALGTASVIFVIAHLRRVPQSLSQTFASAILGISVARHVAVNRAFVATMLSFWICAPLAAIVLIVVLMRYARNVLHVKNVWGAMSRIKALLLGLSFFAAFTLGANTIGLVYAAMPTDPRVLVLVVLAIVIGSRWLSAGELRRVGNEIIPMRYINSITTQFSAVVLMEIATLLGVPLSYTEVFTASVYGAGFSYKSRLLTTKSAKTIGYSWLAMLTISFLMAYALTATLGTHASM